MIVPYVGVDFDGTLAEYHSWLGHTTFGAPIQKTVERVKGYLALGMTVKIVTARACQHEETKASVAAIKAWCKEHIGQELEVTNQKDFGMMWLEDDRARQVLKNEGSFVSDVPAEEWKQVQGLLRSEFCNAGADPRASETHRTSRLRTRGIRQSP